MFSEISLNMLQEGLWYMFHAKLFNKRKGRSKKWIVCTFDDGYKSLTRDALEILKKQRFTATVFVCTGLIGKDNSWNNKDATLREHLDVNDIYLLAKKDGRLHHMEYFIKIFSN